METTEYNQFLEDLDKVLISLNEESRYTSFKNVLLKNKINPENNYDSRILKKLLTDDYISKMSDTSGTDVLICSKGIDFISKGGYVTQFKKEQEKEKQSIELVDSTIKSNKAAIKASKWNKSSIIINALLTIINLIIAYFTLIKK